jgi:hypothetical protein
LGQKIKTIDAFALLRKRRITRYDATVARVISSALNAPIVAFYAFATIDLFYARASPLTWGISFLFGAAIPLAGIVALLKTKRVSDFYVSNRKERLLPFIVTEVSYIAGAVLLVSAHAPAQVAVLMLAYVVNTGAYMMITLYWKISLHAAGLAGPLTVFIFVFGIAILPIFTLMLPLAWSRLRLGAHSVSQVGLGAGVSVLLTYALFVLIKTPFFTVAFHV